VDELVPALSAVALGGLVEVIEGLVAEILLLWLGPVASDDAAGLTPSMMPISVTVG
jgi:hypothetical protein